jgi:hypothetical protein
MRRQPEQAQSARHAGPACPPRGGEGQGLVVAASGCIVARRRRRIRFALLALFLLGSCTQVVAAQAAQRETVTFIFGPDDDTEHPLTSLVRAYYRDDPLERTDRVVADLGSLLEALDYLRNQPPANGQPWGIVNIVAHSNDNGILSVPLQRGEDAISPERLSRAIRDKLLSPLPRTILDEQSEIRLIGCALGRSTRLLRLMSKALGRRRGHRPPISSSLFYTSFGSVSGHVFRCLARACTVPMRISESVDDPQVNQRIRPCVREIGPDVQAVSRRTRPRFMGDSYRHVAEGSFRWLAVFPVPTEPPRIETAYQRDRWLSGDPDFRRYLAMNRIPWEPDQWTVTPSTTAGHDRVDGPSITVRGAVKKLFLVKPLVREDPSGEIVPLSPSWRDTSYYATVR